MPTAIRVLILEDRPEDAELMVAELLRGGFDPMWQRVDTESEYLACLVPGLSVILADYYLPGFDAERALQLLRKRSLDIPFIVVSGAIGEDIAVATMRLGAADYLLKDRLVRLAPAVSRVLAEKRLRDEKRAAEEAQRGAERRYREIFENAAEGIYQVDLPRRIVAANPALARIMGYPSAEVLMATVEEGGWLYVFRKERDEFFRLLEEQGSVHGFECQVYRADRSAISVSMNARAARDDNGKLVSFSGTVVDITELKAAEEAMHQYQEELRDLAAQLILAQETESKRLSRELHDVFSQKLAGLGIELGLLRTKPPASPSILQERLGKACDQISELAVGLHQTARRLHPAVLEDLGLEVALANECAAFGDQHGIQVKCDCRKLPERFPDGVSLCLYRVVQESLRNVREHAQARNVRVTVRCGNGEIVLTIADDGRGFVRDTVRGKGGLGLISMAERVRLVGGRLSVVSRPGGGARVEVRVPSP
jgi:two-component system sensor histidine kinase UhpB